MSQSTPLHLVSSCSWLNAEIAVHQLIEHGAGVNAYDWNHKTPLHRLASSQCPNADSLHLLLENGADVDVEDDEGLTPIQIASASSFKIHHQITRMLLDHRVVSNRT